MTDDSITLADKVAMYVGGGLIVLAVPVLGFVNDFLLGAPPVTQTNDAGEVVASPAIDPHLRGTIALLGLLVLLLYSFYRVVGTPDVPSERTATPETAD